MNCIRIPTKLTQAAHEGSRLQTGCARRLAGSAWLAINMKRKNKMKIEDLLNKWTVLILGIWLVSAIVAALQKDGEVMAYAFWATVLIGFGYMLCYH